MLCFASLSTEDGLCLFGCDHATWGYWALLGISSHSPKFFSATSCGRISRLGSKNIGYIYVLAHLNPLRLHEQILCTKSNASKLCWDGGRPDNENVLVRKGHRP